MDIARKKNTGFTSEYIKVNKSKKKKNQDKKKSKTSKVKKHKSSSDNSNNSGEEQWVEKVIENSSLTPSSVVPLDDSRKRQSFNRDAWMNLDNITQSASSFSTKKVKLDNKNGNKRLSVLDKPGQSIKELNPYWKNGGTGLPTANSKNSNTDYLLDPSWLKKSLKRAQQQAVDQGRCIEEIAAERWGSLETIKVMIHNAEIESLHYKSKIQQVNKQRTDLSGVLESTLTSNYATSSLCPEHGTKKRQFYGKPIEKDDYFVSNRWRHNICAASTRIQKEQDSTDTEQLKECSLINKCDSINNTELPQERRTSIALSETEMNKLGARIIKAELMGQNELAVELKCQLEEARLLLTKSVTATEKNRVEEDVILTRNNAKGVAMPIHQANQYRKHNHDKKKHTVETHTSRERNCYYADDDKYSLQEMYQLEKARVGTEEDATFVKIASKGEDIVETFEQQISQVQFGLKQDNYERLLAIQEHKRMSKSLDNCHWCLDSKYMLKHMIISMDSKICLSLPARTSVTNGHCILTSIDHTACQLHLDEDVWETLNKFKARLFNMFAKQNKCPVFYEIYKRRYKFPHMEVGCIPVSESVSNLIPIYFKKALLECETEWSLNKKIIDLHNKNLRQAIPNGLPYFVVQFGQHSGYAHIIEDENIFPKNFAEETICGILQLEYDAWRKPKTESLHNQMKKVKLFMEDWKACDTP